MTIQQDVRNSWHEAIVELFELDLSPITQQSGDKFYFTRDIFPDGTKPQWKGKIYEPFPIEITGFETSTNGPIPEPELTVANVLGTLSSVTNALEDLVGAKVVRRRTLGKYLDNGTSPNSNEEFPEDVYFIERKTAETSLTITWQLASKIDLEGLQIPRRIITQNYCIWKYRGAECGYTGPPIADERDRPVSGDGTGAGNAYAAALAAFSAAVSRERQAEASLNSIRSSVSNACNPDLLPIANTFSRLNSTPFSFGLVRNGQPLAAFVEGSPVTVTGPSATHRIGRTVSTGFGARNNSTGPVFEIVQTVDTPDGLQVVGTFYSLEAPVSFAFRPQGSNEGIGIVNGSLVTLGPPSQAGFSPGPNRANNVAEVTAVGEIDFSGTVCADAQSAESAAESFLAQASAERADAQAALSAALANLPEGSEVFTQDVCGKRLASCKLRFGDRDLPFGGFPGANLVR